MGSDDPLVPPINGHIMASLIPNAELHMIDDGHLFMVTRPAETARLIEAFLADEGREVAPASMLARTTSYLRDLVPTSGGGRRSRNHREDIMTDNSLSIDMLRKFGSDLGLPKLNVDELLQTQKKSRGARPERESGGARRADRGAEAA